MSRVCSGSHYRSDPVQVQSTSQAQGAHLGSASRGALELLSTECAPLPGKTTACPHARALRCLHRDASATHSQRESLVVGAQGPRKNSGSHIDASHSRQPLVKGERLVRYEVNAVMAGTNLTQCIPDYDQDIGVLGRVLRCH